MKMKYFSIVVGFLISSAFAAQPVSFTYQGKALNAAGTAPLTSTVSFTLSITDPSGACLLYQETQPSINLSTTNGLFALQVGSNIGASKRTSGVDPGLSMTQIFANAGNQLVAASGSCSAGYTPAIGDVRKLHVVVTPTSGSPITISPDLSINAVPNAIVADTIQGLSPTQIYVPVGSVLSTFLTSCPSGYIAANGQSLTTTAYPNLFTAFSYTYGGSGTNFSVPDTRGYFLRGLDTTGVVDSTSGRTLGSQEQDQFQGHFHGSSVPANIDYYVGSGGSYNYAHTGTADGQFWNGQIVTSPTSDGSNGNPRTGPETRPKNLAVNYCIKY
jgi:microcystin-dependent protein